MPIDSKPTLIIVMTAWAEPNGVRLRILSDYDDGREPDEWLTGSIVAALQHVRADLESLTGDERSRS